MAAMDQRSVCSEVLERKTLSKMGADQRSVCSETPWWRVPSKTAADQVSFRSEFLWRRADQRSFGSMTPDRKSLSAAAAAADQRSIGSMTPEMRTSPNDQSASGSETPESEQKSPAAADQVSGHLEAAEIKNIPAAATDAKSVASEAPEKKPASSVVANQNSVGSKVTKGRNLPTKAADQNGSDIQGKKTLPAKADQNGSDIQGKKTFPAKAADQKDQGKKTLSRALSGSVGSRTPERKVLPPIVSDSERSSIRSESPEKKRVSRKSSDLRSAITEIPDRKSLVKKSVIVAKNSKGPGPRKWNSPGSSPVRTWSSPIRTPTGNSPGSSPIRTPKVHSPGSSPIRTPNGHSPRSSALSPCARCSRLNRECRAPSVMSPSRRQINHVSDSEMT